MIVCESGGHANGLTYFIFRFLRRPLHVAGWSAEEVRAVLGIKIKPLVEDPLVVLYGGTPWEPWPASVAADRFTAALANP